MSEAYSRIGYSFRLQVLPIVVSPYLTRYHWFKGTQDTVMDIRLLNTRDLPLYKEMMLEAFEIFPDAFTSTADERASMPDEWWLARLDDSLGNYMIVGTIENSVLTGTVALEFGKRTKTKHKAKLIAMYVRPAAQRRGAGKMLLEFIIKEARDRAVTSIINLTVTSGNHAAIKLYQSFGFERFGVEPMAIATSDGYLGKEHMWLKL